MSWPKHIGRRLEPFAIPHLALILVAGQCFVLVAVSILQRAHAGSKCEGERCYCSGHLHNHAHIRAGGMSNPPA